MKMIIEARLVDDVTECPPVGAHLLAQVRVQEINGELKPRDVPTPLRTPIPAHDPSWDAYLMLEAA